MPTLYTSIAHTKLALHNGGAPPPMVRLPEAWRDRIDPDAIIGMGGLREDRERGLKCPIRGCGVWRHTLAKHLRTAHGITPDELRAALGLPKSIGFASQRVHDKASQSQVRKAAHPNSITALERARGVGGRKNKGRKLAVGIRNLRGNCQAQLGEKIIAIAAEAGRPPSKQEAIRIMGHGFMRAIERTFGTWNQAKQSVGLPIRFRLRHRVSRELVISTWTAFYAAHGRFPSQNESRYGTQVPLVPSPNAVRRALGVQKWAEAIAVVQATQTA
jgi:hypothetical protein